MPTKRSIIGKDEYDYLDKINLARAYLGCFLLTIAYSFWGLR